MKSPQKTPAPDPKAEPRTSETPAAPNNGLDPQTLALIKAADLANIVKKVKAGKPLSQSERQLLEAQTAKAKPEVTTPKGQPYIRKTPYRKPTMAQIQARVEAVARLIGEQMRTKTEIRDYCRQQFNVNWRTADRYMTRARTFLLERHNRSREEVRYEAIAFNEGVIRSETATIKEKLEARREINEIFGIYAPKQHQTEAKVETTVQATVQATVEVPPMDKARLAELLQKVAQAKALKAGKA